MSLDRISASAAADLASFETRSKIAYALAARQLDVVREQSNAVLQLIESANIQGKSLGAGARFDASA